MSLFLLENGTDTILLEDGQNLLLEDNQLGTVIAVGVNAGTGTLYALASTSSGDLNISTITGTTIRYIPTYSTSGNINTSVIGGDASAGLPIFQTSSLIATLNTVVGIRSIFVVNLITPSNLFPGVISNQGTAFFNQIKTTSTISVQLVSALSNLYTPQISAESNQLIVMSNINGQIQQYPFDIANKVNINSSILNGIAMVHSIGISAPTMIVLIPMAGTATMLLVEIGNLGFQDILIDMISGYGIIDLAEIAVLADSFAEPSMFGSFQNLDISPSRIIMLGSNVRV